METRINANSKPPKITMEISASRAWASRPAFKRAPAPQPRLKLRVGTGDLIFFETLFAGFGGNDDHGFAFRLADLGG